MVVRARRLLQNWDYTCRSYRRGGYPRLPHSSLLWAPYSLSLLWDLLCRLPPVPFTVTTSATLVPNAGHPKLSLVKIRSQSYFTFNLTKLDVITHVPCAETESEKCYVSFLHLTELYSPTLCIFQVLQCVCNIAVLLIIFVVLLVLVS